MAKPKITTNMRKLKTLLKEIPTERQSVGNSLYDELLFIERTLDTLKAQVDEEGPVSMFKQGAQEFLREHPALKAYNTTIQRYSLLYKQLIDLLPPVDDKPQKDSLMDFIKELEA